MSAFAYVQSNQALAPSTIAYSSNVTAGNLLICFTGCFSSTPPTTVTDTQGNAWKLIWSGVVSSSTLRVFAAIATATGSNTLTTSLSGTNSAAMIMEYSVPASYSIVNGVGSVQAGNSIAVSSGFNLTLPSPVEFMAVTAVFDQHSGHAWTATGCTIRQQTGSIAGGESMACGDQDATTGITWASPYVATYSGAGSSGNSVGVMLLMTGVSGGGGGGGSSTAFVI